MDWWSLGEGRGLQGSELELDRITCPFCMERGNFEFEHRAEKRKANSAKTLHFDTVRCGNCAGYVMVLWSASEYGSPFHSLYQYRVLPWPSRLDEYPEHWPEVIGRYWLQAHRSIRDENWDAAATMVRSALQVALRDHEAVGGSLRAEIDDLAEKGRLPPVMKEWAHELRLLGNEAAHPHENQEAPDPQDVRDACEFLDFLVNYLYNLPHEIEQYRARREGEE